MAKQGQSDPNASRFLGFCSAPWKQFGSLQGLYAHKTTQTEERSIYMPAWDSKPRSQCSSVRYKTESALRPTVSVVGSFYIYHINYLLKNVLEVAPFAVSYLHIIWRFNVLPCLMGRHKLKFCRFVTLSTTRNKYLEKLVSPHNHYSIFWKHIYVNLLQRARHQLGCDQQHAPALFERDD
jgi:hypothetical protein